MGLIVVARYSVLGEALVARTALHSAGIPAFVADEFYGWVDWPLHTGLQGFRLTVPVEEAVVAGLVLKEARRDGDASLAETPSDIPPNPRTPAWVALGLTPGLLIPEIGFAVEATRRNPTPARKVFLFCLYAMIAWILLFALSNCGAGG